MDRGCHFAIYNLECFSSPHKLAPSTLGKLFLDSAAHLDITNCHLLVFTPLTSHRVAPLSTAYPLGCPSHFLFRSHRFAKFYATCRICFCFSGIYPYFWKQASMVTLLHFLDASLQLDRKSLFSRISPILSISPRHPWSSYPLVLPKEEI